VPGNFVSQRLRLLERRAAALEAGASESSFLRYVSSHRDHRPGIDVGVDAERRAAAGAHRAQGGAFARNAQFARRIVHRIPQSVDHRLVIRSRLNRKRALSDRRDDAFDGKGHDVGGTCAQSIQSGHREHDRVVLAGGELTQTRINVAA
jgi:hypothetical protein